MKRFDGQKLNGEKTLNFVEKISEYLKVLIFYVFLRKISGKAQPKISGVCLDISSGEIYSAVYNRYNLGYYEASI